MTNKNSFLFAEYRKRIFNALEYVDDNLASNLTLEAVAKIACYSSFHFHRVFKNIVGEPLNNYISRRRIEQSATLLIRKKSISISEIFMQFGFQSSSAFSRAFKKHYGESPKQFRKNNPETFSKIGILKSKKGKLFNDASTYLRSIDNHINWIQMNATITIKEHATLYLAYVPQIGVATMSQSFEKLIQWAIPKGLFNEQSKMLTQYHDSFKVTAPNKVRMSIALLFNKPFKPEGEIRFKSIEAGKAIIGSFEISASEFENAWTSMFVWMNEKGYSKSDKDPFEMYHNDYRTHPQQKFIVDLYIPIE